MIESWVLSRFKWSTYSFFHGLVRADTYSRKDQLPMEPRCQPLEQCSTSFLCHDRPRGSHEPRILRHLHLDLALTKRWTPKSRLDILGRRNGLHLKSNLHGVHGNRANLRHTGSQRSSSRVLQHLDVGRLGGVSNLFLVYGRGRLHLIRKKEYLCQLQEFPSLRIKN